MEDIKITEKIQDAEYALVILATTGRFTCEYFTDYPDLRRQQLAYTTETELSDEGIAGYALCKWDDILWETVTFHCFDKNRARALELYLRTKLNHC